MHEDIKEKIDLPEGVEASLGSELVIRGNKGEVRRKFPIEIKKEGNSLIIEAKRATKNEKRMIKTTKAHILNMINGVQNGYEYKLQICSVHFPMNVTSDKEYVIIKNFLGEIKERKAKIMPGVSVKIQGDIITVSGADIEATGQTAANIESATKIKNRDRRVFQDGIWLIKKPGEEA